MTEAAPEPKERDGTRRPTDEGLRPVDEGLRPLDEDLARRFWTAYNHALRPSVDWDELGEETKNDVLRGIAAVRAALTGEQP